MSGGPRQHFTHFVQQALRHTRSLHDVGLLAEVLRHHHACHVERCLAIFVHAAHDQLRPVDIVDAAASLGGAGCQVLHGPLVVVR